MAEHEDDPKRSTLKVEDDICKRYRILKVSENPVEKKLVKRWIKVADETKIWLSNLGSSAMKKMSRERMRVSTNFYKLSNCESQSLLAFNAGAFKLKTAWGDYHKIQTCLAPLCDGLDELEHIMKCPHYLTKWEEGFREDCKKLAQYFVAIDRERRRRYKGEFLF